MSSALAAIAMFSVAAAQEIGTSNEDDTLMIESIIVKGIRGSLQSALEKKIAADNFIEVIDAEDIGKLPDQNLAEVLENITGVQITRTAGVGTNVQIRGTDDNRVEINGVSTLDSGSGRVGIDFEDVNASIISSVEVTKVPEAKTIEGSVGGTINLKTIRPLDLDELLLSVRLQGEYNNLSTVSVQPRLSVALGHNWETDYGDFGLVFSGSYTRQEAVSFRPRADRDTLVTRSGNDPEQFLGIQFLLQEQENDDYETFNMASTFEWAPNDDFRFYFDAIVNDQTRSRDQYRLQASGVSSLRNVSVPDSYETVDFGIGRDLGNGPGVIPSALTGRLEPDLTVDDDDPNLRFTSETNSRLTTSQVYAVGGEWQRDNWTVNSEVSVSLSNTSTPSLNTTVNFINPNCPLDGLDSNGNPTSDTSNDNCVPFIYDLSGDSLAFGINFDSPYAPSVESLTDPSNVVLDQVDVGRNTTQNADIAFRADASYEFTDSTFGEFFRSIDFGYRYNASSSEFEDIGDRIGGFSTLEDSPSGSLFEEILVQGPDNFGNADGRDLYIRNFLLVDPDLSFSDPDQVIEILEAALAQHRVANPAADGDLELALSSDQNAFFDVSESTNSLYMQANFESGIFRGNLGFRYVNTQVDSIAYGPEDENGVRSLVSTKGSYNFALPRFNLIASPTETFIIRFGYSEDILRPSFSTLNTGFTYDPSENAVLELGNPSLRPEEASSIDLSFEWYFAPASVVSIGFFEKNRTNLFGQTFEGALLIEDAGGMQQRETDPTCPGGGVYNPIVVPNVLGDPNTLGLCVDLTMPTNDPAVTTQRGIEVAFQGDLSSFEDSIGWASGFGLAANYTYQVFSEGGNVDTTSGRGESVLGVVSLPTGLLDFSNHAFNITGFYEKYGLAVRMRYTWRDEFRTLDFAGGANTSGSSTFSFPVVTQARGQLNASVSYKVTENIGLELEATNMARAKVVQRCVSSTGPTCFVGFPDTRVIFGATYTF